MRWLLAHIDYKQDACLTWPYALCVGYAQINVDGRARKACQIMCEKAHGARPSPKHGALHSCRNGAKGCINPRHLRWGTQAENIADRKKDGTDNSGARNGQSRLTEAAVMEIRELYATGSVLMRELAVAYGVNKSHIGDIISGRRWGWLNG